MNKGLPVERITQNRIIKLFRKTLNYNYLGNREHRENSNIEEDLLKDYLKKTGYSETLINKALYELTKTAGNQGKSIYDLNRRVYSLLRYGIKVKEDTGENTQTVWLINWKEPLENDFSVAEEVTVKGVHNKRPDIVIYINGIALAVLELKRSTVSVLEGIRQNLDNQKHIFIKNFFSTVQFITAGNDTEGLRYGTIETPEKYYLSWKEVTEESKDSCLLEVTRPIRELADRAEYLLDKNIIQIFYKERFLELIHDFIVYDRGIKKLCRHNQYFGVKAAAGYIKRREGGIIWHTQGSGKSLTMVWLTKWIRENIQNARVLIITDRDELDKQIEKVYMGIEENIYRTKSGKDLINKLNDTIPWLMCSLIHKFGNKEKNEYDEYIRELKSNVPENFKAKGHIYVFVDECHRTQSGELHKAMKSILPDALFTGFTGTPLLKQDKQRSTDIFGKYIHTYKFDEAVKDNMVLDLRYEARDIEQKITSMDKIDLWFEAKTKGLTESAKTELKRKWGTIKKVFSSKSRLDKIVADILFDMGTKIRLQNGRGNAMLVSGSIYQACRYYEMFQNAGLSNCAIITSFSPSYADIKGEETGEGYTEKLLQFEIYQKMLNGKTPEAFEEEVKKKFIEEPAQMKLLIVVDKLLTGFDAPPATYLYIDKKMQDHGLFQAICRVNRLDGDDKEYGYIIDYKDLFNSLEKSVIDYTSGAFGGYDPEDVQGLLSDRLKKEKERLDNALEAVKALCEPVEPPKDTLSYIQYFCGKDTQNPAELKETEPRRVLLYKSVVSLLRAYANIANELEEAGYSREEIISIQKDIKHYEDVRKAIQLASGDYIDLKKYEPAMRHLIDSYIGAEESRVLSAFDDMSLVDLIVERDGAFIYDVPENIRTNKGAMAETIENNLRRVITEEAPTNPIYYEKMSVLLDELIKLRREETEQYEEYLQKICELTKKIKKPDSSGDYPPSLNSPAKRALYDNMEKNEELALDLDGAIKAGRYDGWKGNMVKEKHMKFIIRETRAKYGRTDEKEQENIFELVKKQGEY
ncbi:MAG: HsdR family type I site-specific deoxyribonuclease [Candidatus Eremiobacterota bacterium]